jgi:general secretion pathway protein J
MRIPRRGAAAGFTLLEMVLALVVFSLLVLMVYGAFFVGHRAVIAGEREAAVNQHMRVAEELLGRQLRSAVFYFARYDDDTLPYFIGRPDGMTFVTAAPQSRGGAGLAAVTYQVTEQGLVVEERTAFTPADLFTPPPDAPVARALLLEGFTGLRFDYLPHDDPDMRYQAAWDARDEDTLPAAVQLTVEGLPFFGSQPWVHRVPLMTIAYGWGTDEFREPEDELEDDDIDDDIDDDDDEDDDEGGPDELEGE